MGHIAPMPWQLIEQQDNVSINLSALDGLTKDLDALLKKMPEKKRELHEELAKLAKQEIDAQISASGIDDSSGKIKGWQEPHVGSHGGYAAVRAAAGTTNSGIRRLYRKKKSAYDNSPGAITNYLDGGHEIRRRGENSKRYRPAIKKPYVDGRHFYENARTALESKAIDLVNRFADDLAKELGG
ncbi:hypothetical protein [Faecalispora jeddahensis]|uniref:hypothetical protein n=1 Tax=Faecalispora jeddahensis TaxID=1414721 RepID=UPI001FAB9CE1|nr:hypothetical protein [Faecalispora jeddahensis]MDU6306629.1 hypothetical protein [Clostridium sp.]MDU6348298.1 hypothetical protein [Clostridium sp.]